MSVLQKNKKVAAGVGIAAVAAAALALGAGTYAAYTDTEEVPATTFASGSMDLTVGGGVTSESFLFSGFDPGDSVTKSITLTNTGTVNGTVSVDFAVTGEENDCVEPETDAEDAATCEEGSELVEKALVKVGDQNLGTLAKLDATGLTDVLALNAGKTKTLDITVELPKDTTGNEVMTDNATIVATITLNQA